MHPTVQKWHEIIKAADVDALDDILAEDSVFHSPVVHSPQVGKPLVKLYLTAAFTGLTNDSFEYVREVVSGNQAVLEFCVTINDIQVNGVDMFTWNEEGKITDFKVMIRPLKAINMVHQGMAAALEHFKSKE